MVVVKKQIEQRYYQKSGKGGIRDEIRISDSNL